MNYGRVHWYEPGELDAAQREYYDKLLASQRQRHRVVDERGRLLGPFNARLLDPALGQAIQDLASRLRFATAALSPRLRELVILEVARWEDCGFEWQAHSEAGAAAGLSDAEIAAIYDGVDCSTLTREEALGRQVVRSLLADRDIPDELFGVAEEAVGQVALFDLITLVGHYQHTALALKVWRVPAQEMDLAARATGTTEAVDIEEGR